MWRWKGYTNFVLRKVACLQMGGHACQKKSSRKHAPEAALRTCVHTNNHDCRPLSRLAHPDSQQRRHDAAR